MTAGIKNPPNTKPVDDFKLEMYVAAASGNSCKLQSISDISTSSLANCRKIEESRALYVGKGFAASEHYSTSVGSVFYISEGLNI